MEHGIKVEFWVLLGGSYALIRRRPLHPAACIYILRPRTYRMGPGHRTHTAFVFASDLNRGIEFLQHHFSTQRSSCSQVTGHMGGGG